MKKRLLLLVLLVLSFILSGCCLSHDWTDATCTEPKTCTKCGKTEGNPLGHNWQAATCTEPKTCSVCGATEGEELGHDWQEATCTLPITCERCGLTKGEPLGHDWQKATCTEPKTCRVCGATEGEALGHKWVDATCTEPKTCSVCGATEGEPNGHTVEEWTVTEEATCTSEGLKVGTCTVCEEEVEEPIEMTEHTPGDWIVTVPATSSSAGTREIQCTECGKTLETESYELTEEEKAQAYRDECKKYSYEEISRNPDDYMLENMYFRGKVVQVMEDGNDVTLRVNVTEGKYSWSDTILVEYTRGANEGRILEDDIVKVYGIFAGTVSYESIFGATITIPGILALYVDVV